MLALRGLVIAENETVHGWLTDRIPATGVIFRRTPPGGSLDFHPAPRRQLVITLSGAVELECGNGAVRRLGPGDVLLADDTTGQGHISRELGIAASDRVHTVARGFGPCSMAGLLRDADPTTTTVSSGTSLGREDLTRQRPGVHAALQEDLAVDDRCLVSVSVDHQPAGTGREV